ncbi:hypothetical protein NLJ89_g2364 [Agrocybe chaxingu]|uniref:NCA2-domain-containing protein n=1 Tax=Agrocybe chaxingu TaxID=84603 RepID=A0A9W8MYW5_9AGAR|nr:hypothetical protein NLJ89_g2364 [Agrocybe chaxingu]
MPSEFVGHFTRSLTVNASRPNSPLRDRTSLQASDIHDGRKSDLHALLVKLSRDGSTRHDVRESIEVLRKISTGVFQSQDVNGVEDSEEAALEAAVVGKLTVALYADALDVYLRQATQVEAESEWWSDVENSRISLGLYLVQTLPARLVRVFKTIAETLRQRQLPVTFSSLSPSSIRALFPSPSHFTLKPGLLTTAFFPHIRHQPTLSLAILFPASTSQLSREDSSDSSVLRPVTRAYRRCTHSVTLFARFLSLPLELTRQECRHHRKTLEKLRDERAKVLGQLAQLRTPLTGLTSSSWNLSKMEYTSFLDTLSRSVSTTESVKLLPSSPLALLANISETLPTLDITHTQLLKTQYLLRPSMLTRVWPSLLVLPPLSLYVYNTQTSWVPAIVEMVKDSKETVHGFVQGWLVDPLLDVIQTVRAGGRREMLVHEEGVLADLESLERMTVSLARDTLNYSADQLEALAEKVRMGDLTPVMQVYEEDIRTPLRSALTGTLLRNAFIQVQKAKVDIDQALSGIDRLLKSQELTFAFVGVAPALAIVWTFLDLVGRVWSGGRGRGKYGGRRRRRGVWEGMRRIERLLVQQPSGPSPPSSDHDDAPLSALSTGLLFLSLTRLRSYALRYLPPNVRAPFLEDLGDLEDTSLGRDAKLRVVDRMWRCWGTGREGVFRL